MNLRTKLEITGGLLALTLILSALISAVRSSAVASATEAANKKADQVIAQHDAAAKATLDAFMKTQQAQMDALNKKFDQAKTAPDIAAIVQQIMALQKPITFVTPPATPQNPNPQPVAQVPAEDAPQVKKYVQDCEQCKLDLQTAKTQLTYEQQRHQSDLDKLNLANKDIDTLKKAAKGGGFWSRLKGNTKAAEIGGAVAVIAICVTGHCK